MKENQIQQIVDNAKSSPLVQTLDAIIGMYVDTLKKREDEK